MSTIVTPLLIIYGVIVIGIIAYIAVTYNQLVRLKNKLY